MPRRWPWIAGLLLAVMVLGGFYSNHRAQDGDRELPVYVRGAERMAAGEEIYRLADDDKPFTYPPFAALAFTPMRWVPEAFRATVWFEVNLLLLFGVLVVIERFRRRSDGGGPPPGPWRFWIPTLLLGAHHVTSVFTNQSHDLVIALALALAAAAWCRGNHIGSLAAGFWSGVGAAFKATPLLLLGLFGLRLRIGAVAVLLATAFGLSFLPDLLAPRADHQGWLAAWYGSTLRSLEIGGTAALEGAWNSHSFLNQGLSGTLTRLFTAPRGVSEFVDPGIALAHLGPTACKAITITGQLLVLGLLSLAARSGARAAAGSEPTPGRHRLAFGQLAAFACGMVLLSPQSSKAHFCVWLFPAAFLVDRWLRGPRDRWLTLLLVGALALGLLSAKGLVGRSLGNHLLAAGVVTWSTALLLVATVRVLRRDGAAAAAAASPSIPASRAGQSG